MLFDIRRIRCPTTFLFFAFFIFSLLGRVLFKVHFLCHFLSFSVIFLIFSHFSSFFPRVWCTHTVLHKTQLKRLKASTPEREKCDTSEKKKKRREKKKMCKKVTEIHNQTTRNTSSVETRQNKNKKSKVLPGIEPGLLESVL